MNLQNLSKGLNLPIALTFLFAFILTILVNILDLFKINNKSMTLHDLSNNNIESVIYVILVFSLICLILNLTVFRLLKNKLLSSVIFLVSLVGLFISSILLIVNVSNLNSFIPISPAITEVDTTQTGVDILYNKVIDPANTSSYTDYTHLLYITKNNSNITIKNYAFYKIKDILLNKKWPITTSRTPEYSQTNVTVETIDTINKLYNNINYLPINNSVSYTDFSHLIYIYNNNSDQSLRNYALQKISDLIYAPGSIKSPVYQPPTSTYAEINESNINVIKGLSYFLGILGVVASLTNKGLTLYKLMK